MFEGGVVAIIGAGPGGLVAARHALGHGLTPVVFERSAGCGGVWGADGKVWDGLRTNLSKYSCQFTDHPWGDDAPLFPSGEEVRRYLESYVARFGLADHIHYGCEVMSIAPSADGTGARAAAASAAGADSTTTNPPPDVHTGAWDLTVRGQFAWAGSQTASAAARVVRADHVIVASGIFGSPMWPAVPGVAELRSAAGPAASRTSGTRIPAGARLLHAQHYKPRAAAPAPRTAVGAEDASGHHSSSAGTACCGPAPASVETLLCSAGEAGRQPRALVIGGSLTSVEIAADIAVRYPHVDVVHYFRRPFYVIPRLLPVTATGDGACAPPPGAKMPLDLVFYNRKFYEAQGVPLPGVDPPTPDAAPDAARQLAIARGKHAYMCAVCAAQDTAHPALRLPEEPPADAPVYATISDTYVEQVRAGRITPVCGERGQPRLVGFAQGTARDGDAAERLVVKFERGGETDADGSANATGTYDMVVCATGFRGAAGFLDENVKAAMEYDGEDTLQPLILFKETYHPRYPSLFFVGFYKGPYFPVMELQAKWAARVFSGVLPLPPAPVVQAGLVEERRIRAQTPRPQFPHPDYVAFADSIAHLAGEVFDLPALRRDAPEAYAAFAAMSVTATGFTTADPEGQVAQAAAVAAAIMSATRA